MSSIFRIPELLNLVCSNLRPTDAARLGRTSRVGFSVAMAFAWNHVRKADNLFRILPHRSTTNQEELIDIFHNAKEVSHFNSCSLPPGSLDK